MTHEGNTSTINHAGRAPAFQLEGGGWRLFAPDVAAGASPVGAVRVRGRGPGRICWPACPNDSGRDGIGAGWKPYAEPRNAIDERSFPLGSPYALREPQPTPRPLTPSSLPATLPAYIDCALFGNIIPPHPPCIGMPIPPMPPIPMPKPAWFGYIGLIEGVPNPRPPDPPTMLAATVEPRSHSSSAAAIACCATAIWNACLANIMACWCAARKAGSAFGGILGYMNC